MVALGLLLLPYFLGFQQAVLGSAVPCAPGLCVPFDSTGHSITCNTFYLTCKWIKICEEHSEETTAQQGELLAQETHFSLGSYDPFV